MAYPEKWRETCDPFALAYHEFRPTEVLGYPHAGNDVFRMRGEWEGREVTAYVKVARQESANLANEVNILSQLDAPIFPRVLDCDREGFRFSVTEERPGERLSMIVGDNEDGAALSYMEEYGGALARLHAQTLKAGPRAERRFHHRPTRETLEELKLTFLDEFFADSPKNGETVFCHGDFHYANVLWKEHHISAILDFELAGYGNRDFDIAVGAVSASRSEVPADGGRGGALSGRVPEGGQLRRKCGEVLYGAVLCALPGRYPGRGISGIRAELARENKTLELTLKGEKRY